MLGTDWAAVDLIYISRSLQTLKRSNASSEVFDVEIGSIGAAFSIAFWGTARALRQLIVCFQLERVPRQRVGTIAIELLLPTVSLCVAFLAVDFANPRAVSARYGRRWPFPIPSGLLFNRSLVLNNRRPRRLVYFIPGTMRSSKKHI